MSSIKKYKKLEKEIMAKKLLSRESEFTLCQALLRFMEKYVDKKELVQEEL